jgi:hypothetical protein
MTAEQKKKAPSKRRKQTLPTTSMWYAAMHEINVALSLAGGFIGPRTEQSAAQDHHVAGKGLQVFKSDLPKTHLSGAAGGLDYGSIVIVEVELDSAQVQMDQAKELGLVSKPVPLSKLRRLLFANDTQAKEFAAKIGGYADVPQGIAPLVVEAERFELRQSDLIEELPIPLDNVAQGTAAAEVFDKTLGGVACLLSVVQRNRSARPEDLIAAAIGIQSNDLIGSLINNLISELDGELPQESSRALGTLAANVLASLKVSDGLSGSQFLALLERAALTVGEARSAVDSFVKHASDVLSSKRELVPEAFTDSSGKIVARALLLCLLNPDIDRLNAAKSKMSGVGDNVFLMASVFLGMFAGLTNLPINMKAPSTSAFIALTEVGGRILDNQKLTPVSSTVWTVAGSGRHQISVGAYALVEYELKPSLAAQQFYQIAEKAGLSPQFESDNGVLTFRVPNAKEIVLRFRESKSISFPVRALSEIFARRAGKMTKRDAALFAAEFNSKIDESHVIASVIENGKSFGHELRAQIENNCGIDALVSAVNALILNLVTERVSEEPVSDVLSVTDTSSGKV